MDTCRCQVGVGEGMLPLISTLCFSHQNGTWIGKVCVREREGGGAEVNQMVLENQIIRGHSNVLEVIQLKQSSINRRNGLFPESFLFTVQGFIFVVTYGHL